MQFSPLSRTLIDIKQFKTLKKIKKGGYGQVYLVEESSTKKQYAAKILDYDMEEENSKKMIDRVIALMLSVNNPTLIKIYGFSLIDLHNEKNVTIIMELAKNGSLLDILEKVRLSLAPIQYDDTNRQKILIKIARGMKYLHDRNIIHRDLSTNNILLDKNLHPIKTDFGMSKLMEYDHSKSQSIFGGKYEYMAPEVIDCVPYDYESDVYSFGIIMYQVVTDSVPYQAFSIEKKLNQYQLIAKVAQNNYRPVFDKPIKKSFEELIKNCWSKDPKNRPSFKEIFKKLSNRKFDCFFEGADFDQIEDYIESITDDKDAYEILIKKVESNEHEKKQLADDKNQLIVEKKQLTDDKTRLIEEKKQLTKDKNQLIEEKKQLTKDKAQLIVESEKMKDKVKELESMNKLLQKKLDDKKELVYEIQPYIKIDYYIINEQIHKDDINCVYKDTH